MVAAAAAADRHGMKMKSESEEKMKKMRWMSVGSFPPSRHDYTRLLHPKRGNIDLDQQQPWSYSCMDISFSIS